MSTVTHFVDGIPAMELRPNLVMVRAVEINFALRPGVAGNVFQVLRVPRGSLVTKVSLVIKTAQGALCTASVGDVANASGWIASANLNGAVNALIVSAAEPYNTGRFYATESTINLTLGHVTNLASIVVIAEYSVPHGLPA